MTGGRKFVSVSSTDVGASGDTLYYNLDDDIFIYGTPPSGGSGGGPTGPTGPIGPTGPTGSIGPTGSVGATGTRGATGSTGPIGPTGSAGPTGIGVAGATGPTGFLSPGNSTGDTPYWNGSSWVTTSSLIYNDGTRIGIGATGLGTTGSSFNFLGTSYNSLLTVRNTTGDQGINIINSPGSNRTILRVYNDSTGASSVFYRSLILVDSIVNDWGASAMNIISASTGANTNSILTVGSGGLIGSNTSRFGAIVNFGENWAAAPSTTQFDNSYWSGNTLFWSSGDEGSTTTQSNLTFLLGNYAGTGMSAPNISRYFSFNRVLASNAQIGSTSEILRIGANDRVSILNERRGESASSSLHVNGSFAVGITGISSPSYTATIDDHTIEVSAAGGARTILLPAASSSKGRIYVIKKIDSSVNTVTVDANLTETIDGATTYVLTGQWHSVVIQSNGTSWIILSKIT